MIFDIEIQRVEKVLTVISSLEKKDTRVTFYSSPRFPEMSSANIQFSTLSSEQLCDPESVSHSISVSEDVCIVVMYELVYSQSCCCFVVRSRVSCCIPVTFEFRCASNSYLQFDSVSFSSL